MESRLWIRHAEAGERAALEALQWRASLANEGDRDALLAHPDAIQVSREQIEAKQVFVAILRDSIIGFAAVLDRKDGAIELDGLFVEPHIWKSGTGRSLIARCVRYAREHHAETLRVVGNPHAEGFYIACGFSRTGIEKTRFGTGLLMSRRV